MNFFTELKSTVEYHAKDFADSFAKETAELRREIEKAASTSADDADGSSLASGASKNSTSSINNAANSIGTGISDTLGTLSTATDTLTANIKSIGESFSKAVDKTVRGAIASDDGKQLSGPHSGGVALSGEFSSEGAFDSAPIDNSIFDSLRGDESNAVKCQSLKDASASRLSANTEVSDRREPQSSRPTSEPENAQVCASAEYRAQLLRLQQDENTYLEPLPEHDDLLSSFEREHARFEERIAKWEKDDVILAMYTKLVIEDDMSFISHDEFWRRYLFRQWKLQRAESKLMRISEEDTRDGAMTSAAVKAAAEAAAGAVFSSFARINLPGPLSSVGCSNDIKSGVGAIPSNANSATPGITLGIAPGTTPAIEEDGFHHGNRAKLSTGSDTSFLIVSDPSASASRASSENGI